MARLKILLKRKLSLHHKTNQRTPTLHSSQVQNSTLSNYSNVNTTPNDNPADNTLVNIDYDSPVKVYSKTNYHFPPPTSFHSATIFSQFSNLQNSTKMSSFPHLRSLR